VRYPAAPLVRDAPTWPIPGCRAGVDAVLDVITDHWGLRSGGCYNPRPVAGSNPPRWSYHARGQAGDPMADAGDPAQRAKADDVCARMTANPNGLGLMRIIWNQRTWTCSNLHMPVVGRWRRGGGHTDHIHFELALPQAATLSRDQVRDLLGITPAPAPGPGPNQPTAPIVPSTPSAEADMRVIRPIGYHDEHLVALPGGAKHIPTPAMSTEVRRVLAGDPGAVHVVAAATWRWWTESEPVAPRGTQD
jgi:hypothetical protein